jgi:hypothetical protein
MQQSQSHCCPQQMPARPANSPRNGPTATSPPHIPGPSPRAVTETAVADRIGAGIVAVETSTAPAAAEPTSAELRTCARAAGITVPDRRRLRPEVWQAWRDAHAAKRDCP